MYIALMTLLNHRYVYIVLQPTGRKCDVAGQRKEVPNIACQENHTVRHKAFSFTFISLLLLKLS